MRAIVCTKYGSPDVLKLVEVGAKPPKDDEIQVRIHATTVTAGDCRVRSFNSPAAYWLPMRLFLGITKPRKAILGVELAGEVVAIGKNVKRFQKGDPIFAFPGMRFGAHAEYICLPEDGLVAVKPDNASYEEAAAILSGGTTALYFLRRGQIRKGQQVLIYGASGSVGTSAVQLAKYLGAEVTGVCSTSNIDLVRSLGADRVIDYTKEDWLETCVNYDLIFDAVGKIPKFKRRKGLASNGVFVTVDGQGIAKVRKEDLEVLKTLMEMGKLIAAIDRSYPLERMAEAHAYVEQGHKRGNVVITV
ncbi:NAD(P)-dependent alcohol dehydrogenase [Paenibacillus aestuarii]|uniref:NAD(P)-dependent alcohol dehydrogenase n=1 Tax=Paenibacillus aestuarii TaxID=516965 RepID=A0ABW0K4Z8_9BACL|nr:NAD(P)-dependent alcohol dehydrogenase [Paenibacillus aestuarii]